MIYITTKAYNAEATLSRAIESILNQSYTDFRYHLCDNGSTDGTAQMIRKYAAMDNRITPFFNKHNMEWTQESEKFVLNMARHLADEDWLCVLDADDDYSPDFLKEMLQFANDNQLEYVACRSNFIDEVSGNTKNEYTLNQSFIMEKESFGTLFPDYFRFMGARWGKLQKGSMLNCVDFNALDAELAHLQLSHRSDTFTMLWYLRYARRAGVLAKLLHNYRLYPASHSRQNIESKIQDNYKMPDVYRAFLKYKVGAVSDKNEAYIKEVFERSMQRTKQQKEKLL